MKRQNILYPKAEKALRQLGENLRLARKRRKITAQMMSERANLSLMTLRSLERGSPNVSMCNYMAVIACLGFQEDMAKVAANDELGWEGSATVNFNINFRALTNWSLWAQGKDSIEDEGCGEKEEGRRNHTQL